ncbi:MAG: deoxyribonuclease IV [Phycisphaerales bacterium]|nr:deoxyribonuclease IV [Phycisphaerales bacterium]MCB9854817.1 deoxyribonuclease IV [Phycisphaerales bacterium]MCB9863711.1 deoxyribonuclease IV [Phycisphaerales bacterium]
MANAAAKRQKFGSHLSVAGGFENAFHEGVDVGCDCLQIFVKNQRQWSAKPITDEQIAAYKQAESKTGIGPVVAHASYLLNLASPEAANREKSIKALIDELERCEALGVVGLVLHPGAHMGDGEAKAIKRISASLNKAHTATKGFKCRVLLESTAGQGTTIGHEVEHLGQIIDGVKQGDRLGICLDTCHLFAAGYDLRDSDAYEAMMQAMDASFGVDRIACIHMNDSKFDLGSRKDRHEHIGEGFIGRKGFVNVVNDARLADVPRILETEKGDDDKGRPYDKVNLDKLRRMVRG